MGMCSESMKATQALSENTGNDSPRHNDRMSKRAASVSGQLTMVDELPEVSSQPIHVSITTITFPM